jgi:uncharacterized protein (TIGR02266 family)
VEREPVVGDVIDQRYTLKREIARGGMGAVFEAEQRETGRTVALKLVVRRSRFVRVSEEQLLLEAQAIGAVRHPGVVDLLDVGVCTSFGPYLALEMLVGRTLDGIIAARRTLPVREVARIGRQVCEALAVVHERRIVHRDLKPSNVFIALEDGREVVKLFDFGIAALGAANLGGPSEDRESFGTPEYMAPEQLLGEGPVDQRADLYAAGVTLFECLTGEVPYSGTMAQVLMKVARASVAPSVRALRSDVGEEFDEVLAVMLATKAEERFASGAAVARAIGLATGFAEGSTHLLGDVSPAMQGEVQRVSRATGAPPPPNPRVQRLFERVPYVTVTEVRHEGVVVEGRSEDISLGGMLVRTAGPLPAQARIRVKFALPREARDVVVPATIRWSREARGGDHANGVQFVDLPNDCRKAILEFVRNPEDVP